MASLSSYSSSASSSRSSSFSSSAHRRNAPARGRGLPRRGQVKAAIFASLFASIASVLRLRAQSNGANEEADAESESRQPSSDFEVDVGNDTRLFDEEEEGARMELRVPAPGVSASFSTVQHGSPHLHAVTVEGQVRVEGQVLQV